MTHSDLAASAEDRSRFFWWLAEWFLHPPSPDQLASLAALEDAFPGDEEPFSVAWRALAAVGRDELDQDALGAEYTRLCGGLQVGHGPPPPYESVWREDRLVGEVTVAVLDAYTRAGFADIDPEAGPQDHLSVELKFIALLALREAEAWQAGDEEQANLRRHQQTAFLRGHLTAWAPRWAGAIRQLARHPLYAALAGLTQAALIQAEAEAGSE
jgi:TorA maturation chaperone TorD